MSIGSTGNVGIGTTSPGQKLDVVGSIKASSWLRTTGNYGWHNDSHGGGIYMTDSTYVRVYGAKRFLNDKADQYAFYATNGGVTSKSGFYKIGENNNSILLAGGGTKALSDFLPTSGGVINGSLDIKKSTSAIPALGARNSSLYVTANSLYGMQFGIIGSGVGFIQQGRTDGTATSYSLSLQPSGGNVLINNQVAYHAGNIPT